MNQLEPGAPPVPSVTHRQRKGRRRLNATYSDEYAEVVSKVHQDDDYSKLHSFIHQLDRLLWR